MTRDDDDMAWPWEAFKPNGHGLPEDDNEDVAEVVAQLMLANVVRYYEEFDLSATLELICREIVAIFDAADVASAQLVLEIGDRKKLTLRARLKEE